MDKDITDKVIFDDNDGECLSLMKCVCGKEFEYWEFILNYRSTDITPCDNCGRKMYFKNKITVFEVDDG